MKILTYLAESFIAAFGITRPAARQERLVTIVLGGFLLLAGIAAVTALILLLWQIHSAHR